MSDWGVDNKGISTPSYSEILDYFGQRWEEEFGTEADLSSRSPEGQFLRVIAETISNKGLPWSDITSIWGGIEDVYNAGFLSTASGASLEHVVSMRGLSRKTSQAATGTVLLRGEPGDVIEEGYEVSTLSGVTFETTRPVTINSKGVGPVPARAVENGEEGNVVARRITDGEVEYNPNGKHTLSLGKIISRWGHLPNTRDASKYQLIPVNSIKYGTSVDEFTVTFRSHSSGLYGVQISVQDHESGEVIGRTEVREKKLGKKEEWEVTFKGQGFDLLKPSISDHVRIIPKNMEYSVDDIEIGLGGEAGDDWYDGVNSQPYALSIDIVSKIRGAFTGGIDKESDVDLKNRFLNSLSRGGSTRPSAIKAELHKINSMKHVQLLENTKGIDYRPDGLPPNSIEVVVWGGSNEDILQALLHAKPAGINTYGENVGTIQDEFGQTHQFQFSRARERNMYINVEVITTESFPPNGGNIIKNICANFIGGEDLDGSFHPGRVGVGDTVYQSEIESEIHTQVSGVRSIQTEFGLDEDDIKDEDLSLGTRETPIVKPDNIFLSRGVK